MTTTLFHMASSHRVADEIVHALLAATFNEDAISLLFPDRSRTRLSGLVESRDPSKGLTLGMAEGLSIVSVPELGQMLAGGPIRVALNGVGRGGTKGGFTQALVSLGITQPQAALIEAKLRQGEYFIAVQAASQDLVAAVHEIFRREAVTQVCEDDEEFGGVLLLEGNRSPHGAGSPVPVGCASTNPSPLKPRKAER